MIVFTNSSSIMNSLIKSYLAVNINVKRNIRKIKSIVLLIVSSIQICAQIDTTKYLIIWTGTDTVLMRKPIKADMYRDSGLYSKAIIEYKTIISKDTNDKGLIYNAACTYALMKEIDSAFKYLNIALINDSTIFSLIDPDFFWLTKDLRWCKIEKSQIIKSNAKLKNNTKLLIITAKLYKIILRDQAFYHYIAVAEKKFGVKSKQVDSLWGVKSQITIENLKEIQAIMKLYGWPKISVFGSQASSAAFLVIQHTNYKIQKKYLTALKLACGKNEANWSDFAMLKDRVLIQEGRCQLYGTQVIYDEKEELYKLLPICNPEKVDFRRKEIGLAPLKEYLENWRIEFNIPQIND
jgi:hypothetical protein